MLNCLPSRCTRAYSRRWVHCCLTAPCPLGWRGRAMARTNSPPPAVARPFLSFSLLLERIRRRIGQAGAMGPHGRGQILRQPRTTQRWRDSGYSSSRWFVSARPGTSPSFRRPIGGSSKGIGARHRDGSSIPSPIPVTLGGRGRSGRQPYGTDGWASARGAELVYGRATRRCTSERTWPVSVLMLLLILAVLPPPSPTDRFSSARAKRICGSSFTCATGSRLRAKQRMTPSGMNEARSAARVPSTCGLFYAVDLPSGHSTRLIF